MLEKKGSIYSDRPTLFVVGELIGWVRSVVFSPYGPRLRDMRRLFAQLLGSRKSASRYMSLIETETRRCMVRFLHLSEHGDVDIVKPVRKTSGAIILAISFGYQVKESEDPFVNTAEAVMEEFSVASAPGAFLVDILPILQYLPEWMPGGGWKKKVAACAKNFDAMYEKPIDYVKKQLAAGVDAQCFAAIHIGAGVDSAREELVKMAAHGMYAGGADTTVSTNTSFILMMMLHPDIQKKAQAEVDVVVGPDRFPELADRNELPYVSALCSEILRLHPVVPSGIIHRLTEDDVHAGYFIPKGTYVIANIWQHLHDSRVYSDPFTFKPERFLGKTPERDPRDFVFGYGRRICPGNHLADLSIFTFCATILALFDISPGTAPAVDLHKVQYTTGTISHPPPFECSLKPRSSQAEALIRSLSPDEQQ
ncbi:Multifunctional cytochrome P450 monooxygenase af510 [Sparassis crispa]|uniref:Multifunctional cytochrome P450 monooxygenase af510 n=1 Tax=Sparassis crispa TaxID=139825 RepID=A0A401GW37_9APHY|nr:Multifunctional cytochrome P450 monooxygenase af510 [Sparassis crispa]GBE86410.1 Multifunctional cytochrome P450 monooxygenase af510 [Sparassis crispa]